MKRSITNKHLTILIILIGLVLFVTSCDNNNKTVTSECDIEFEIIIVDGCEYLFKHSYYQGYLAHKGNCKNH